MATTTSITTTYAGESAGKYISAALLAGNTIANGGYLQKYIFQRVLQNKKRVY